MIPDPVLWRATDVPPDFCATEQPGGRPVTYGGDLRIGDLRNQGRADLLVYRSVDDAHDGGGVKPCFLGAFDLDGRPLWRQGQGGTQPCRPGPVAIHDLDGDGHTEVICFFHDESICVPPTSMADVVIQLRDGATGAVKHQAAPAPFRACHGHGPNWAHQRILVANFRGRATPHDFVVKLGEHLLAFDDTLDLLWAYESPWTEYGHCPAYIPAVGDIDGDGRDEVNGGYFLLDHDGTVLWQNDIAPHMDSVAIEPWDGGKMRAICSGHGHVLDTSGRVILKLGAERVPHGQEVRVAPFRGANGAPLMVIRYNAHTTGVQVVDTQGTTVRELDLNPSPNNTGMEAVYWTAGVPAGISVPLCNTGMEAVCRTAGVPAGIDALLYNGGMLWDPMQGIGVPLPGLPAPDPIGRMAWYHCIPADICGDRREELVLYNPWTAKVYIYTQADNDSATLALFRPGPRQYNPRLMD